MSVHDIDQDTPQHVDDAYHELYNDLYRDMGRDWYGLLELVYGDTFPEFDEYAVMPSLIAFSVACERRQANEGATSQLPLTIHDEIGYGEAAACLYESDNEEPDVIEARTRILVILDGFWTQILEHPRRCEPLTMTPFDMVWRLLERQKQMAEAGEGRMARVDRLLDLLLQEEFVGLFPMVLTKEQWAQLFLADFELEDLYRAA
ncbi:hypothetical protein E4U57_000694 [Claviceps arundinis]|uniref:Uncharacterized protein n=1 Tax=Claviceps arundinis TaxID=1623583 RepID=A0ABQ7PNJ2_9HYPO|nr:hypothetical protein E4U57_000694 [Claviceps arundinis]